MRAHAASASAHRRTILIASSSAYAMVARTIVAHAVAHAVARAASFATACPLPQGAIALTIILTSSLANAHAVALAITSGAALSVEPTHAHARDRTHERVPARVITAPLARATVRAAPCALGLRVDADAVTTKHCEATACEEAAELLVEAGRALDDREEALAIVVVGTLSSSGHDIASSHGQLRSTMGRVADSLGTKAGNSVGTRVADSLGTKVGNSVGTRVTDSMRVRMGHPASPPSLSRPHPRHL